MIIAIWGNAGAGKSTVAIKIALEYAQQKKNVVLIDTNFIAPQTKIWFPKETVSSENSMATILENNIELDAIMNKIYMANDYLGVLGYARDLSVNSFPSRNDTPPELLSVLSEEADVIVVDCQSNITQDIMTFTALDVADAKVICLTPDLRGLAWYESNVPMLKEKWTQQGTNVITAFSKVKVNSPADALEKALGNINYYFPYYEEIEEELYIGTMGSEKYKGHSKKYGQIIKTICEEITESFELRQNSISAGLYDNEAEEQNDQPINIPVEEIPNIFAAPDNSLVEDDDFDDIPFNDIFQNTDNEYDDIPIVTID